MWGLPSLIWKTIWRCFKITSISHEICNLAHEWLGRHLNWGSKPKKLNMVLEWQFLRNIYEESVPHLFPKLVLESTSTQVECWSPKIQFTNWTSRGLADPLPSKGEMASAKQVPISTKNRNQLQRVYREFGTKGTLSFDPNETYLYCYKANCTIIKLRTMATRKRINHLDENEGPV